MVEGDLTAWRKQDAGSVYKTAVVTIRPVRRIKSSSRATSIERESPASTIQATTWDDV